MTGLAITKLDVLSGLDTLRVAVRYRHPEGALFHEFPYHQSVLHHAAPEYEELPGWDEDITGVRSEEELPQAARDYLAYISDFVRVPVTLVGVGPGREQVIWAGGQEPASLRAA
jgi:adenylosuccinate synthase